MACGGALEEALEPTPLVPLGEEERRTVTILFADIVGSTSVFEQLDHETVKGLLEPCLERLADEVSRFGGHVDKFIGDAIMALFGAPVAHGDDAERALRAAFAMQRAMPELNGQVRDAFGFELALRIGLNTGEVLAGRIADSYTVVGDAVNVASRLQAAAPVGGILVGERTERLTAAAVSYRALEPLALKGKADKVGAWEALELQARAAPTDIQTPPSPLVGREEELSRLQALCGRVVRERSPQLVTVVGQAGVGKSRLLNELETRLLRERAAHLARGRCLAFGQGVVYWPLAEMLRAECAISEEDDAQTVRAKLHERLGSVLAQGLDEDQVARRLAPLARVLGAGAEEEREDQLEGQGDARDAFFGAVRAALEALASEAPLVLAWEDIHWADEGTLDLIDYLSHWLRAPVLQICLAREELLERRPSWSAARRTATIMFLEPLAQGDAQQLVDNLLLAARSASAEATALAERCGGNPLFAEALVARMLDGSSVTAADLPETIHGVLAARLDALSAFERQLIAHAAVLGRTFWESSLRPLAGTEGGRLEDALLALIEKDIIVLGESAGASQGDRELAFKHVLIRDVAYEMLPRGVRARKHAEIGAFLSGGAGEALVGVVAEHYARAAALGEEARLPSDELAALRRFALDSGEAAGDAAASMYANAEALVHYEAAAALTDQDEGSAQRIGEKRGDIALRLGRADPAIELWESSLRYHDEHGGGPEHVADLHRKIGSALAHTGERKQAIEHLQKGINLIKDEAASLTLVRLYEDAAWLYMQVGDNMLAIYAAEKALRLAEELGAVRAASRAHGIFGRVFGRIGDTAKARENLERAVELARQSDASETVLALSALGHNMEHSDGDYGAAGDSYRTALELAERIGDVPAQIELQSALAQLAFHRCDWEQVRTASDMSAGLAEREGLVGKLCLPDVLRGRLRWRDGDWDGSVRLLETAQQSAERIGWSEVAFGALLALAATLRDRGDLVRAEATLREALSVCDRAGLAPQSVQAYAALALVGSLALRPDLVREGDENAQAASTRVRDPASSASALEAAGLGGAPGEDVAALREALATWERLDRPLDAARCQMLVGRRLLEREEADAAEALNEAAESFEAIGIAHLAERARDLARSPALRD